MPDIAQSVGLHAQNDDADVIIVQRLLNAVPASKGGANPIMQIDGWCGPATIAAISRFQAVQLGGFADGNIEPGHKTITLLNAKATEAGARPVPDLDPDPATQAREDAQKAAIWGMAGLAAISGVTAHVQKTGGVAGFDTIVETALAGHFHITSATPQAEALRLVGIIRTNYIADLSELAGGRHFRSVGRHEMHTDFAGAAIKEAPGYTPFTSPRRICWSSFVSSPARSEARFGVDWPWVRAVMPGGDGAARADSFRRSSGKFRHLRMGTGLHGADGRALNAQRVVLPVVRRACRRALHTSARPALWGWPSGGLRCLRGGRLSQSREDHGAQPR